MKQQFPIKLIVGLGNPGQDYDATRHNAGQWFVETIAERFQVHLKPQTKFKGMVGDIEAPLSTKLLVPLTFMNLSGQSIQALSHFYKIAPNEILVAHDELDLPVGTIRIKQGGGHGGHNGLRDTINQLGSKDFFRLRIGIGHPGVREQVVNYVLNRPNKQEQLLIDNAINDASLHLEDIVSGEMQRVMNALHQST